MRGWPLLICIVVFFHLMMVESKMPKSTQKNHELLNKLGFSRIRTPNSHHKKRLAVESRHHARSDDSHMFIIKLPPNQHYYVHNKPNSVVEPSKNVPIGFKSNGKPGKIYHWNMPVVKKLAESKQKAKFANNNIIDKVDSSWNDVLDKPTSNIHNIRTNYKKPSYYVPSKPKKSSFFKYFPGNGKPQSFYVIEKNKKLHHHRLLP